MRHLTVICSLTLRSVLSGWRLVVSLLLAAFPVLIAGLLMFVRGRFDLSTLSPRAVFHQVVPYYFHPLVILLGILFGSSVIADDEEDGSVVYLVVRPIRRGVVYLGKTLAAFLATSLVVLLGLLPTYAVLALAGPISPALLIKDLGWLLFAGAAYPLAFAALAARSKKPLAIAAAYFFLWEVPMAFAPTSLRLLTLSHYVLSLLPQPHVSEWHAAVSAFGLSTPAPAALLGLGALGLVWLIYGANCYEQREHLAATAV